MLVQPCVDVPSRVESAKTIRWQRHVPCLSIAKCLRQRARGLRLHVDRRVVTALCWVHLFATAIAKVLATERETCKWVWQELLASQKRSQLTGKPTLHAFVSLQLTTVFKPMRMQVVKSATHMSTLLVVTRARR